MLSFVFKLIIMKTKEIIELLEKEFDGKNYIITSAKDLEINIEIPSGVDAIKIFSKISDSILLIKYLFSGVTKLDLNYTQADSTITDGLVL
jgi:hypothetical protein